ncbi:hypothetical protein M0802_011085 [Mischocyttarus mexicanus]|nr:hypothetical protein M0802_011085 [Mischocyttarus mexicanus]
MKLRQDGMTLLVVVDEGWGSGKEEKVKEDKRGEIKGMKKTINMSTECREKYYQTVASILLALFAYILTAFLEPTFASTSNITHSPYVSSYLNHHHHHHHHHHPDYIRVTHLRAILLPA